MCFCIYPCTKIFLTFRIEQMLFCATFRAGSYVSSFSPKREIYVGQESNRKTRPLPTPPFLYPHPPHPSSSPFLTHTPVKTPLLPATKHRSLSQLRTDLRGTLITTTLGKREVFLMLSFTVFTKNDQTAPLPAAFS